MYEIKCPKCGEVFSVDESGYAAILQQVRDEEFNKELERRKKEIEKAAKAEAELDKKTATENFEKEKTQLQLEKEQAKSKFESEKSALKVEHEKDLQEYVKKEAEDKAKISKLEAELQGLKDTVQAKLDAQKAKIEVETKDRLSELEKQKDLVIADKDEEIERIKNNKMALSTKALGEDFEQWCFAEFQNAQQNGGFPNATFEKDTKSVKNPGEESGTKGDFIFKDYIDGQEYLSIMLEMKTEQNTPGTKKKNKDHLKKLYDDMKKKNCEFAVLVSTLEEENDLYNRGIVKVPQYKNMYVVRPQFMLEMIAILQDVASKSVSYKKEIIAMQQQNFEVEAFNAEFQEVQRLFSKHYATHCKKTSGAIKNIDTIIDSLEKVKIALIESESSLAKANKKLQTTSGASLSKHSPKLKKQFKEIESSELQIYEDPDDDES